MQNLDNLVGSRRHHVSSSIAGVGRRRAVSQQHWRCSAVTLCPALAADTRLPRTLHAKLRFQSESSRAHRRETNQTSNTHRVAVHSSNMRSIVYVLTLAALAAAAPAPQPAANPDPAPQPDPALDSQPEIIEIIAPAANAQETLATLNLGAAGSELSERNKRTVGILRQLFPQLTQIIEQKVQQITSTVLRVFGPVFLKAFLGNRNNGKTNGGGGTVEIDDDDEDDDDDDDVSTTIAPTRRRRALYFPPPNSIAEDNQLLSGAESQQAEVRVAFGDQQAASDQQPAAAGDQQTAAQTNSATIDEITLDDADDSEENRNKRFLSFGGGASSSGGGSGNFLFDVVRLVAGSSSGASSSGGEAEGEDGAKGDGLTEGVPGPITRLFIIANRGVANLIQDLILRIAQTSERIVNFKARLITSII
ncbi:unnamed protein product [Pieris brassicae]|uniref:Uncharacterized protein n=2 Tax=Pieris brassicae TaxID=7116 RepID=A0A9P0XHR1_PIEBR|nr:unnamed protein product [Pieris brassicae]